MKESYYLHPVRVQAHYLRCYSCLYNLSTINVFSYSCNNCSIIFFLPLVSSLIYLPFHYTSKFILNPKNIRWPLQGNKLALFYRCLLQWAKMGVLWVAIYPPIYYAFYIRIFVHSQLNSSLYLCLTHSYWSDHCPVIGKCYCNYYNKTFNLLTMKSLQNP